MALAEKRGSPSEMGLSILLTPQESRPGPNVRVYSLPSVYLSSPCLSTKSTSVCYRQSEMKREASN